ncbi:MAG: XRE family transcriptional regulator [Thalassotalea sp.]|nr:XRE family transcriptional regulator [Thalassotalea sp.]
MKVKSEISINLGKRIKSIRVERGLSLSQLSKDSGVSKAMLGQIERFESSPTVELLWKLSQGLNVEYTSLLTSNDKTLTESTIDQEGDSFTAIYASQHAKIVEIFHISLGPFSEHKREAHSNVKKEYLTLIRGELEVFYNDNWYSMELGQQIQFNANQNHGYRTSNLGSEFINILEYK